MKVVLITGSSRGIGLGLVKEYISQGYKVIATCRKPEAALELQAVLANGNQSNAVQLDVETDESIFKAAEEVAKVVDWIDILINNAGVCSKTHPNDPALKVDRADALRVYNTNVIGPLKVTEAFLPLLKKGSDKKVINISSSSGSLEKASLEFSYSVTTYSASKAALNMVTRYQAFELPEFIIASVDPGWVDTELGTVDPTWVPDLTVEQCAKLMFKTIGGLALADSSWYFTPEGDRFPF